MRHAYTGNVHDGVGGSTYCHGCGKHLIGRDWYILTDWNLNDFGRCQFCDTSLVGVFDGPPGDWGSKRIPVRISNFAA